MKVIDIIKRRGLKGVVNAIVRRLLIPTNKIIYSIYSLMPIDSQSIVLESEGDCSDNAFALFEYMKSSGYISKYKITWLVEHPEKYNQTENVKYCQKQFGTVLSITTLKSLATCRWYIYDHCNVISDYKKRNGQLLIYLSHGWGYKAAKGRNILADKSDCDYMTATGPLSAKGLSDYWNRDINKTVITGYPRMDYFFENNPTVVEKVENKLKLNNYNKILFWMPTFRQSINENLSENYINNETGLPIFNTSADLIKFDSFLKKIGILMVFKLHHLQAELPVFHQKFSNIVIVRDNDLTEMGVQLYQLVKFADCMISDYSSITIDYLLMDRPIIYTLDDYEEYNKSRGLYPENAIDYMPGYHVYSIDELMEAIKEVKGGVDRFSFKRKEIIGHYHTYKDGNSAKRVLDEFGIKL